MKITYNLTAQDFVSFQEYYMKKKAPLAGCMQPVTVITLVCNVIAGVGLYIYQGVTTYTYVCLVCILLLGLLLIGKGQNKKRLLKSAQKMEREKPGAFGNMTMEFNEKGIDIHSTSNDKFLTWDATEKYDSNKDYYFIYSKKGMVYIIPKRDLRIEETAFTAMLDQYLNKA